MHRIKLTKPFKLGNKMIPAGIICAFNREKMNELVRDGDAFYCSDKGFEVAWDENIAGPQNLDEEE